MKQVKLGLTGERVSEFCLGCMMMGTSVDKKDSFRILDDFVDRGGNFLDTANCYSWWMGSGEFIGDESENILGAWMKERGNRDKIFLATKVGGRLKDPYTIRNTDGVIEWDRVRSEYEGLAASTIRREVEHSLRRLKTDHIDLYYTHVYDNNTPIVETLDVLNSLIKEGKIRYIGASNLTTKQLYQAVIKSKSVNLASYMVLQQEYSYLHPRPDADTGITSHGDREMIDLADKNGIAFLAYSPLLKGIYGDEDRRRNYYNWENFNSEENISKLQLVDSLAAKLGITARQLVLAWMLGLKPSVIPILGFSKPEQYYENIAAADIELTEEYMAILGK